MEGPKRQIQKRRIKTELTRRTFIWLRGSSVVRFIHSTAIRGWGGGWRSCHFNLEVKIFHHFHDLYWQNFLFRLTKLLLITKVMTEILALTCCVLRWICHQSPKWCMTNSTKIVPTRLVFLTTNDSSHLAGLKKTKSNCCLVNYNTSTG